MNPIHLDDRPTDQRLKESTKPQNVVVQREREKNSRVFDGCQHGEMFQTSAEIKINPRERERDDIYRESGKRG